MELNTDQIKTIRNSTSIAFDLVLKDVIYQASQNWRTFVRQQLHKGGGILFKHISKEDKAYLNVDISKFGKDTCSPSIAIAEQTEFWSQSWAPPNESLIQEIANDMKKLRSMGFDYISNYTYTTGDFLDGALLLPMVDHFAVQNRAVDLCAVDIGCLDLKKILVKNNEVGIFAHAD